MRPVENLLAILAALLVAGAVFPWSGRIACAFGAMGVLLLMMAMRLRAHGANRQKERIVDVYARIDRVRTERQQRYTRYRPGMRYKRPDDD